MDILLEAARAATVRRPTPVPAGVSFAAEPQSVPEPSVQPQISQQPQFPQQRPPRQTSTGSVLLGLGALSLLVAAVIFVTVSWSDMGLGARALVLLGVTSAAAGVAGWATARGLRASAETLWLLAFAMFALDWYAVWAQRSALGLGHVHVGPWSLGFVVIVVGLAAAVVRWSRSTVVAPDVVAACVLWISGSRWAYDLWQRLDWRPEWALLALAAFMGAVALVATRAAMRWTRLSSTMALAVAFIGFLLAGVLRTVTNPTVSSLTAHGAGLPVAVAAALAVAAAWLTASQRASWSALAIASVGWLLAVPGLFHGDGRWGLLVACILLVVLAAAGLGPGEWLAGARIVAILLLVLLTFELLLLASVVVPDAELSTDWAVIPWPFALAVTVSLSAAVTTMSWWRGGVLSRDTAVAMVFAVAEVGALTSLATASAPSWLLAATCLLVGAVALGTLGQKPDPLPWTGLVLLAPAIGYTTDLDWLAVGIGAAFLLVLAPATAWVRPDALRAATAAGATIAASLSAALASSLSNGGDRGLTLALVLTAVAAVTVASLFARPLKPARCAIEVCAALAALAAVAIAVGDDLDRAWGAMLLALIGSTMVAMGAVLADRRPLLYTAGLSFAAAWVLTLLAADVQTVEAYSGPIAAVMLGIGGLLMLRDDALRSWPAIGAGVVLALGPSLPGALAEPTSLRAILLGFTALVALGVGAWRSWQAPFLLGVGVAALLVAVNLWPLALALQRWVLFAGVGAVLLVVGVTWEQRVAQGRVMARFVARMR